MAKKLTRKQELFVAEYLTDLNATRAAIASGYSPKGAEQTGSVLLRNPKVQEEIAKKHGKRLQKLEITADKVLEGIAQLAYYDPRKFFNDDGTAKTITELDDDTAMALCGFELIELFEGDGDDKHIFGHLKKFKIADKGQNLERLGRHLKLFTDKVEHSGTVSLETLVCGESKE